VASNKFLNWLRSESNDLEPSTKSRKKSRERACNCGPKIRDIFGVVRNSDPPICKWCGNQRVSKNFSEEYESNAEEPEQIPSVEPVAQSENQDIIAAIDRTTHAVRAFVLFLFYQLTALTLAYFIFLLAEYIGNSNSDCSEQLRAYGACSPNLFLVFVAFLTWLFGVFYSSTIGWEEIRKSEVPVSRAR